MGEVLRFGIIGLGYWGPNYARLLGREMVGVRLVACADSREERIAAFSKQYPETHLYTDHRTLLDEGGIDAVVVATPSSTHSTIVRDCLRSGKHVLVEKPMALSVTEATSMMQAAADSGCTLMIGHTFLFNPVVRWIKHYLGEGALGRLYYLYFQRTGLGPIRRDVNVLWDLAPHDLSMLRYWLCQAPLEITARGESYLRAGTDDVAFLTLRFPGNVMASIHVSWLDPIKTRRVTIVGERKMLVFDDTHPTEKLRVYDKGASYQPSGSNFAEFLVSVRDGDVLIPHIEPNEPLKEQLMHFVECVTNGRRPTCDGADGRDVVILLEQAQRDLDMHGPSGSYDQ